MNEDLEMLMEIIREVTDEPLTILDDIRIGPGTAKRDAKIIISIKDNNIIIETRRVAGSCFNVRIPIDVVDPTCDVETRFRHELAKVFRYVNKFRISQWDKPLRAKNIDKQTTILYDVVDFLVDLEVENIQGMKVRDLLGKIANALPL